MVHKIHMQYTHKITPHEDNRVIPGSKLRKSSSYDFEMHCITIDN